MGKRHALILEVSNVNDEELQEGMGKLFNDFCDTYKGAGITASVLKDESIDKVLRFIKEG